MTKHDITYGILNPGSTLHLSMSPEADYASALISATNDALVHHWLPQDERYRASLSVYVNDPSLAVAEIDRWSLRASAVEVSRWWRSST